MNIAISSVLSIAASLVVAYLLGSIPTAYIVGKARKVKDIREVGTRNMGAMNTFYSVGFWWGAAVLAVDIGKGVLAVLLANILTGSELAVVLAGAAAILGHRFPVFLKFRGGKGGATTLGVLFYLIPWGIPICVGLFGLLLLVTRAPTISYSLAFVSFPLAAWLVLHRLDLVLYSILLVMIPLVIYVPRILEMRRKAGSWRHVFRRRNLADRF